MVGYNTGTNWRPHESGFRKAYTVHRKLIDEYSQIIVRLTKTVASLSERLAKHKHPPPVSTMRFR